MKVKVFLILGTLVLLAGCTSTSSGGSNSSSAGARRLASDLNAMNGGSTAVNGNTIMLIKGTSVQKDLIVPTGVTLEITGDGGLYLQDNITLTVNGTINAPSNKIGWDTNRDSRSITINGNGTINLMSKGCLLGVWGGDGIERKLTLDGVTLVGLADNDSSLVVVIDGSELVMKSGTITGNTRTSDDWAEGGGVFVANGSTFIMEGGEISGNSVVGTRASSGGGVVVQHGPFIMEGGVIYGNSALSSTGEAIAGGIRIVSGTFTMKGGSIYGNTAQGRIESEPGGVFVSNGSIFIMEGGRIQGSTDSDGFTRNTSAVGFSALKMNNTCTARWGTDGTYIKGGVSQAGDSFIVPLDPNRSTGTDDTLIAIPAP